MFNKHTTYNNILLFIVASCELQSHDNKPVSFDDKVRFDENNNIILVARINKTSRNCFGEK